MERERQRRRETETERDRETEIGREREGVFRTGSSCRQSDQACPNAQ